MLYQLQEATFELTGTPHDRSVNVFVFSEAPVPVNIVVTRDFFNEGGSVEQLLRDQLKNLAAATKEFKELEFATGTLPSGQTAPTNAGENNAVACYVSYIKQGQAIYQKMLLVALPARKVLVFTGTCGTPWTQEQVARWKAIFQSLQIRPAH